MQRQTGFSLVEVTLAIGLVGFALLAIVGLLPVGSRSARDSVEATQTSFILQDVTSRMRAYTTTNDTDPNYKKYYYGADMTGVASFFFYTSDGQRNGELIKVPYTNDQPLNYNNVRAPSDFYRAKVTLGTFDQAPNYPATDPRQVSGGAIPEMLCATVEIASPIDSQNGNVIGKAQKTTYTFLVRKP